jgi:ABC-type transport system substrate-binding protein
MKSYLKNLLLGSILLSALTVQAAAPKGTLYGRIYANPKALNPLLRTSDYEKTLLEYVLAKLMFRDLQTNEYFPYLAEKIESSKDLKSVTVTLRSNAVWEDGSPITTADAEFTYDRLMDPKVQGAHIRSYFTGVRFIKIDEKKFKFEIENPTINTLPDLVAMFWIMQKKQYEGEADFNKAKAIQNPISSGPYRIKNFSRDQKVELERVTNWWGDSIPQLKNFNRLQSVVFRIIPDAALAYEKFLKGEVDVTEISVEAYALKVLGLDREKVGNQPNSGKKIWATQHKTQAPPIYNYLGLNLHRPYFRSKKTRQALAQLVDYDTIIDKMFYNLHERCYSPFGSKTKNAPTHAKANAFQYQPKKAMALLKEDGWSDTDGDSIIDKVIDGKKVNFEFTLRYNSENQTRAKMSQMIKEQFKHAGIEVTVQAMEWTSYLTQIDSRDFDAFIMAWVNYNEHADAKQIWHSTSHANQGSNAVGYANPQVDEWIMQSRLELNPSKRFKLMQKISAAIYDDQPYLFLSEIPGYISGYSQKVKGSPWSLRYSDTAPIWMYSVE